MTRRRPPENDFICRRCGCACDAPGTRHLGGGSRDMRACGQPPEPVLRSELKAQTRAEVAAVFDRMPARRR